MGSPLSPRDFMKFRSGLKASRHQKLEANPDLYSNNG